MIPAGLIRDPKDEPILGTAVAGNADVLCTRDLDLCDERVRAFARLNTASESWEILSYWLLSMNCPRHRGTPSFAEMHNRTPTTTPATIHTSHNITASRNDATGSRWGMNSCAK
jgi:hypothetical protein